MRVVSTRRDVEELSVRGTARRILDLLTAVLPCGDSGCARRRRRQPSQRAQTSPVALASPIGTHPLRSASSALYACVSQTLTALR